MYQATLPVGLVERRHVRADALLAGRAVLGRAACAMRPRRSAPHFFQRARLTHLYFLILRFGCLRRSRLISRFERFTRTRLVVFLQRRVADPDGAVGRAAPRQLRAPHLLAAVGVQREDPAAVRGEVDAAVRHDRRAGDVALGLASPSPVTVENVHAGESSGTSAGEIDLLACPGCACSTGRGRSERHSPPGDSSFAQPGGTAAWATLGATSTASRRGKCRAAARFTATTASSRASRSPRGACARPGARCEASGAPSRSVPAPVMYAFCFSSFTWSQEMSRKRWSGSKL